MTEITLNNVLPHSIHNKNDGLRDIHKPIVND